MFITQSLKNLLDKLIFACVLLMGIQLPNFAIQYQQSLDAHYQESHNQLQQYQDIADRFYLGDMDQLLAAHQNNAVTAIRAEAKIITSLIERSDYLQQQLNALQNKQLIERLWHLLNHLNFDIADEVLKNYSLSLPLNSEAIIIGLALAFACNVALQIILATLLSLLHPKSGNNIFHRS